ncbi:3-methyl-2-oxobutanoate hydroxymethyltransferase [Halobium salinum]|uniref:3-methyl-2-oxobutanoate hydroxymethyltransferase n=1 Tax=Halobium salinum TaxID=1364940 RepID=A0ABD5PAX1_9EURY|nr:3-methyl-2-oxobutanoate hydroxymethyltransferase [Halobium salinum]
MPGRSVREFARKKRAGEPITMLTTYDAPTARLVDEADIDIALVGDSIGNTQLGYDSWMDVSLDEIAIHTAAVARSMDDTFLVADLPFMSYGATLEQGVESAGRLVKEAGADAVKLETPPGGEVTVELVDRLVELGIPVQGHIGLNSQREKAEGGNFVQGRDREESATAEELVETAQRLEAAGAFSLILELTAEGAAKRIAEAVDIPVIGIGAGRYVNGQVLVVNDVLGFGGSDYRLSKEYADLDSVVSEAISAYADEVRKGEFPAVENTFDPVDEE